MIVWAFTQMVYTIVNGARDCQQCRTDKRFTFHFYLQMQTHACQIKDNKPLRLHSVRLYNRIFLRGNGLWPRYVSLSCVRNSLPLPERSSHRAEESLPYGGPWSEACCIVLRLLHVFFAEARSFGETGEPSPDPNQQVIRQYPVESGCVNPNMRTGMS